MFHSHSSPLPFFHYRQVIKSKFLLLLALHPSIRSRYRGSFADLSFVQGRVFSFSFPLLKSEMENSRERTEETLKSLRDEGTVNSLAAFLPLFTGSRVK